MTGTPITPQAFPQPYAISGVVNHNAAPACNPTARFAGLSAREREACIWAAAGLSNRDIGVRMGIAEMTVRLHLKHAMRALGIGNRCALVSVVRPQGCVGAKTGLTAKEAFILQHIYAGKTMDEIADLLGIERNSIKGRVRALYKKIGVDGRVHAARWWFSRRVEG